MLKYFLFAAFSVHALAEIHSSFFGIWETKCLKADSEALSLMNGVSPKVYSNAYFLEQFRMENKNDFSMIVLYYLNSDCSGIADVETKIVPQQVSIKEIHKNLWEFYLTFTDPQEIIIHLQGVKGMSRSMENMKTQAIGLELRLPDTLAIVSHSGDDIKILKRKQLSTSPEPIDLEPDNLIFAL